MYVYTFFATFRAFDCVSSSTQLKNRNDRETMKFID